MIYITGDTHGNNDIHKLSPAMFPEQNQMTKDDYVIICGDFGCIWTGDERDNYLLDWLEAAPFTTLWIDGNHENFNAIYAYPVREWSGGKVHFIRPSVIHLMRGQVFIIEGERFFTMGGGTSIDKEWRRENYSWWPQEQPSEEEYDEAFANLTEHNHMVDYIITHTTTNGMMEKLGYVKECSELNNFLEVVDRTVDYKEWFCGHFHRDIKLDEKHTFVYNGIIRLK